MPSGLGARQNHQQTFGSKLTLLMSLLWAKMSRNINGCVICLEPLCISTIGAAVPCGHCFHEGCFESWRQSFTENQNGVVGCPLCKAPTNGLCRLYLDTSCLQHPEENEVSSPKEECTGETTQSLAIRICNVYALELVKMKESRDEAMTAARQYKRMARKERQKRKEASKALQRVETALQALGHHMDTNRR